MPRWSGDEDELLREHYPANGGHWDKWEEILPNRTPSSIVCRANRLGIACEHQRTASVVESTSRMDERATIAVNALDYQDRLRLCGLLGKANWFEQYHDVQVERKRG